jgi:hypothetical protein
MRRLFTAVGIAVLVLTSASIVFSQNDLRNGTWNLNTTKSKQDPTTPPRKSETRTYEVSNDTQKMNTERINGDGSKQSYGYEAKFDGKDYPVTGQGPDEADSISMKRADAYTVHAVMKKAGKDVLRTTSVVSKDGKTLTLNTKGTHPNGKSYSSVTVYDKQ